MAVMACLLTVRKRGMTTHRQDRTEHGCLDKANPGPAAHAILGILALFQSIVANPSQSAAHVRMALAVTQVWAPLEITPSAYGPTVGFDMKNAKVRPPPRSAEDLNVVTKRCVPLLTFAFARYSLLCFDSVNISVAEGESTHLAARVTAGWPLWSLSTAGEVAAATKRNVAKAAGHKDTVAPTASVGGGVTQEAGVGHGTTGSDHDHENDRGDSGENDDDQNDKGELGKIPNDDEMNAFLALKGGELVDETVRSCPITARGYIHKNVLKRAGQHLLDIPGISCLVDQLTPQPIANSSSLMGNDSDVDFDFDLLNDPVKSKWFVEEDEHFSEIVSSSLPFWFWRSPEMCFAAISRQTPLTDDLQAAVCKLAGKTVQAYTDGLRAGKKKKEELYSERLKLHGEVEKWNATFNEQIKQLHSRFDGEISRLNDGKYVPGGGCLNYTHKRGPLYYELPFWGVKNYSSFSLEQLVRAMIAPVKEAINWVSYRAY